MPRCPTCGRLYDAGTRFCPDDGSPLADEAPPRAADTLPWTNARTRSASQELDDLLARTDAPGPDPQTAPPRPAAPYGGHAATPSAGTPDEQTVAADETDAPPRRSGLLVVALVVGILLAGAAVAAYVLLGSDGLEEEAYDAIARGDLVTPDRLSAFDFAQRIASQDEAAAARVGARAFPKLVAAADAFYARFYTTSEASAADWERTARLTAWAARVAPDDAHVRARDEYARARIAQRAGDRAAARAGYTRAAEAWPEWALPPNSLGRVLDDARDARGAEAAYRRAARLDPAWPFPLSNLGALYVRQRRYGDAARVLDEAVRLDPNRAAPRALLASALAGDGRYADAIDAAVEALRRDPAGESGFDANALRARIRAWEQARDEALADEPVDDDAVEPDTSAMMDEPSGDGLIDDLERLFDE